MISLTCEISKDYTNALIYKTKTVTNVENKLMIIRRKGFPGCSDGKASACNARDPSSIPGEGIGYPL